MVLSELNGGVAGEALAVHAGKDAAVKAIMLQRDVLHRTHTHTTQTTPGSVHTLSYIHSLKTVL